MDDVQPLLLPQTHTATDIFIDTIASTSGTSTVDIPITEIEMRPILHKKPTLPTEPRVLSIHGPREELPEQELPIGPDIHDVNRQKIVIRPRCKEYVQKQKQRSIRTLACFSATLQNSDENEKTPDHDPNPDADPEADVAMKDIVTSFAVKDAKKTVKIPPLNATFMNAKLLPTRPQAPTKPPALIPSMKKKVTPKKPRAGPPTEPRAMVPRALNKPRVTVSSGRIEKPPRSPPRTVEVPDLPMDAYSAVVLAQYELYSCGCSAPDECVPCTLRRLADKFCAIVAERKERIRLSESWTTASAMCS